MTESPAFAGPQSAAEVRRCGSPEAFRHHPKEILRVAGTYLLPGRARLYHHDLPGHLRLGRPGDLQRPASCRGVFVAAVVARCLVLRCSARCRTASAGRRSSRPRRGSLMLVPHLPAVRADRFRQPRAVPLRSRADLRYRDGPRCWRDRVAVHHDLHRLRSATAAPRPATPSLSSRRRLRPPHRRRPLCDHRLQPPDRDLSADRVRHLGDLRDPAARQGRQGRPPHGPSAGRQPPDRPPNHPLTTNRGRPCPPCSPPACTRSASRCSWSRFRSRHRAPPTSSCRSRPATSCPT